MCVHLSFASKDFVLRTCKAFFACCNNTCEFICAALLLCLETSSLESFSTSESYTSFHVPFHSDPWSLEGVVRYKTNGTCSLSFVDVSFKSQTPSISYKIKHCIIRVFCELTFNSSFPGPCLLYAKNKQTNKNTSQPSQVRTSKTCIFITISYKPLF